MTILSQLPPPPSGKTGWPWTEESPPLPPTDPAGETWPKVSIVTPSYNQGQFIEETIRSVLLQNYPNLEYLIIDGGSTDNSVEIIRKYEPWLTYWVSERDSGQSEALNKGFARTTGSIMTWLNSDDVYEPGAIHTGVNSFLANPSAGVIYGDCGKMDEFGNFQGLYPTTVFNLNRHLVYDLIPQPASFFHRQLWEKFGPLNETYHYILDYDLFTMSALEFQFLYYPQKLARMRLHSSAKTVSQAIKFTEEHIKLYDKFFSQAKIPVAVKAVESEARGVNFFTMGYLYFQKKDYLQAKKVFQQSLSIYPNHPKKLMIFLFWLDCILKTGLSLKIFQWAMRLKHPQR